MTTQPAPDGELDDAPVSAPDETPAQTGRQGVAATISAARSPRISLRGASYAVGLAFLAMGVYVAIEAPKLGLYVSGQGPGPGFFPFGVSLLMIAMAALWLSQIIRGQVQPGLFFTDRSGRGRAQVVLVALTIFIALLTTLGYMLAAFVFMIAIFRIVGRMRWITSFALAVCGAVALQYGFVDLLQVPLPASQIGFIANIGI
jgi:putative tricarboxylic transport membrane protein